MLSRAVLSEIARFNRLGPEFVGAVVMRGGGYVVVSLPNPRRGDTAAISLSKLRGMEVAALWHTHHLNPPIPSSYDMKAITQGFSSRFPHIIAGTVFRSRQLLVIYYREPFVLRVDGLVIEALRLREMYAIPLLWGNMVDFFLNRFATVAPRVFLLYLGRAVLGLVTRL